MSKKVETRIEELEKRIIAQDLSISELQLLTESFKKDDTRDMRKIYEDHITSLRKFPYPKILSSNSLT